MQACCIKKGQIGMHVKFDQNSFDINEKVKFHLSIENARCKANLKGIKIKIVERIEIHTSKKYKKDNTLIKLVELPTPLERTVEIDLKKI